MQINSMKHITNIIQAVSDPKKSVKGRMRQTILLDGTAVPTTLIVHEGTFAVYRTRDKLLLCYFEAPYIVGMNAFIDANKELYLVACGDVTFELQQRDTVLEKIDQLNLWKDASLVYMHSIKRLIEVSRNISGAAAYDTIRENLLSLMQEKKELRLTVNACDYIQEKTHLSRSRIMKILADLRTGGHIAIKRGILMEVKSLPVKY